jgi:hypothetical protein
MEGAALVYIFCHFQDTLGASQLKMLKNCIEFVLNYVLCHYFVYLHLVITVPQYRHLGYRN